jgi:hypothetical protein
MDMRKYVRAKAPRFGTTTWNVISADRLIIGLDTACLKCGNRFRVARVAAVMKVGQVTLRYFCPTCVKPEIRERILAATKATGHDG